LFNLLQWLQKCRAVAQAYNINPQLPDVSTINREQWEIVEDLFQLMSVTRFRKRRPLQVNRIVLAAPVKELQRTPIQGIARFDNPNPVFHLFGNEIRPGPLRTILTNATAELESILPDGRQQIVVKGGDNAIQIVERYVP